MTTLPITCFFSALYNNPIATLLLSPFKHMEGPAETHSQQEAVNRGYKCLRMNLDFDIAAVSFPAAS